MTDLIPLRFSTLKYMVQSPAHYRAALERPFKPSAAQKLGTAVHRLVFENAEVRVFDGASRNSKAWTEFAAQYPDDDSILLASEYPRAVAMRDALYAHPDARSILWDNEAITERTLNWTIGGRKCSGTPDSFVPGRRVTDLKTTLCADPRKWLGRYGEIRKYSYHAQVPWYDHGIASAFDTRPVAEEQLIVAVESKYPHPVMVYQLHTDVIEEGTAMWRSWFERLRVCEDNNHWPGYSELRATVLADDTDDMPDLVWGEDEEAA